MIGKNQEIKISVITIVYNDIKEIEKTMNSYFSQTWENKEYIVIDGGSNDGTKEIIEKYHDRIAYFCSEADHGIYDAMNKGIMKSSGDWICFLNSGDYFVKNNSLEKTINSVDTSSVDIIYGNSIEVDDVWERPIYATRDTSMLEYFPLYRHGSSLVRAEVQKRHLFDLSKKELKYALDEEMIFRLYREGFRFKKADVFIQAYKKEGASNHPYLNLWYNYKITSEGKLSLKKLFFFFKMVIYVFLKNSTLYKWLKAFAIEYMVNDVLPHIPFWTIRRAYLKMLKMGIGKGSFVMKKNYFMNPNKLSLGQYSHINRDCILDARGGIIIGNCVSISHRVNLMTGSHDVHSKMMLGVFKSINIDDYVWIGVGATILQGVTIGRGAVICAGAVVTKNIEPYDIAAGVPAKVIGKRRNDFDYKCKGAMPLT
jgi:acetyltransferase-like isoleucine patch superfamily enzyme